MYFKYNLNIKERREEARANKEEKGKERRWTTVDRRKGTLTPNGGFGSFFKAKRSEQGVTLRQFASIHNLDPGNLSKMERGLLPPPQNTEKLEDYAKHLGIQKGSDDWYEFFDLAATGTGRIPDEILSDGEVMSQLPLLFRTFRGQKVSPEKLDKLIKKIKGE